MNSPYLRFEKDSLEYRTLIEWWRGLDKNRGERAVLRRSRAFSEIVFSPAYHRLRSALLHHGTVDDDGLALLAGLAVHVKVQSEGSSIAEQMATGKPDGSARVSGLRFRRLLKVKERAELFGAMIRIIALLGGTTNIQSLAQSMYFWNDRTRKRWAYEYYTKAAAEA